MSISLPPPDLHVGAIGSGGVHYATVDGMYQMAASAEPFASKYFLDFHLIYLQNLRKMFPLFMTWNAMFGKKLAF